MTVRKLVTLLTSLCNEDGAGECEVRMEIGGEDTPLDSVRKESMVSGDEYVFLYGKEE